ncbi:hypothetical protein OROMI_008488 [Orobanche minor]
MGRNIEELYLSTNKLDGPIRSSIINASKLTILEMSVNLFSGCIPNFGNLRLLQTLSIWGNNLTEAESPTQEMNNLGVLGLYGNMLVGGPLPNSLGNFSGLIEFDLSCNNLSGSIPKYLEGLPLLKYFNVSYNKLEGRIPDGGPFHNFTAQSFVYNLDLCGSTRFQVQSCSQNGGRSTTKKVVRLIKMALRVEISPLMIEWRRISYIELEQGTSSFAQRNLLGRGSYSSVFEATLSDGLKVADKVFNLELQGALRSFDTETEIMGSIRHRNLVQVIGSALEYLHNGYTFPIVHCDVKPSNVLIDGNMVAHLSDFGISKLFDGGEVFMQTQTLATIGYAARELGTEGKVSINGDVYSFGIMLLEMFTGKRPTDDVFGGEMSLKEWVIEALQHNAATKIAAPALLSRGDRHFAAKEHACHQSLSWQ